MARLIDENKMLRINEAATELIVEKGYGNASISAIAKKAEVAEGYLYRFHSSKEGMVNALLSSKIEKIIEKMKQLVIEVASTRELLNALINDLFSIAEERPMDIKFLYVLMHDYSFLINEEQRAVIKGLIQEVLQKGREQGEIGNLVREEEVYNMAITYPIVFLNLRLKNFFGRSSWNNDDKQQLIEFCIKALKA